MSTCVIEYVVEQFSEDAEELDDRTCQQSSIQSVTTDTTAAAAAVCMETSFGMETDEPRTHIHANNTRSEYRRSLPLVPGLLIGCFSHGHLIHYGRLAAVLAMQSIIVCCCASHAICYVLLLLFMSPLRRQGDIYSFASWQNRHFGGVFRP